VVAVTLAWFGGCAGVFLRSGDIIWWGEAPERPAQPCEAPGFLKDVMCYVVARAEPWPSACDLWEGEVTKEMGWWFGPAVALGDHALGRGSARMLAQRTITTDSRLPL
jgi:hypothetical protein